MMIESVSVCAQPTTQRLTAGFHHSFSDATKEISLHRIPKVRQAYKLEDPSAAIPPPPLPIRPVNLQFFPLSSSSRPVQYQQENTHTRSFTMHRAAFRPAARALSRHASPASRRFASTSPVDRPRSWKSSALRWGLAGGAIYYYSTSSVFAEEPARTSFLTTNSNGTEHN